MLLTFHHLIPKDTHKKYEGKRLPPGVDGPPKPSREFLNQYAASVTTLSTTWQAMTNLQPISIQWRNCLRMTLCSGGLRGQTNSVQANMLCELLRKLCRISF